MGGYKLGWLSFRRCNTTESPYFNINLKKLKILNGNYVVFNELRKFNEKELNQTTFECTC